MYASDTGVKSRIKHSLTRMGFMVLEIAIFLIVTSLVQLPLHRSAVPVAAGAGITAALALITYWLIQRHIERRAATELRTTAVSGVVLGFVLGVTLLALTIAFIAASHAYTANYAGLSAGVAGALILAIATAIAEELLFRGFVYRMVRDEFGVTAGIITSAALFGLAHAFNHGATILSTMAIAVEAGILLSVAYQVTNALWLPIGVHAGWNFAEASIFGTSVSGSGAQPSVLIGTLRGPAFITGGAFGPEASIIAILVCLAAAVALWAWPRKSAAALRARQ